MLRISGRLKWHCWVDGIERRLRRSAGCRPAGRPGSGKKQIEKRDEEASSDEHDAGRPNRPRAFVAHILGHIGDGIQQTVERQADLNHFGAGIVGGMLFGLSAQAIAFGGG